MLNKKSIYKNVWLATTEGHTILLVAHIGLSCYAHFCAHQHPALSPGPQVCSYTLPKSANISGELLKTSISTDTSCPLLSVQMLTWGRRSINCPFSSSSSSSSISGGTWMHAFLSAARPAGLILTPWTYIVHGVRDEGSAATSPDSTGLAYRVARKCR